MDWVGDLVETGMLVGSAISTKASGKVRDLLNSFKSVLGEGDAMNLQDRLRIVFAITLTVQLLIIALHDLVDIRGWVHGSQVQQVMGRRKVLWATAINSLFPGLAVALAIAALFGPIPHFALRYSVIYCAVTVVSAIAMWYVPYCLDTDEKTRREYQAMYAGTRHLLPPRAENPRPNVAHLCFHVIFLFNLALALTIGLRS